MSAEPREDPFEELALLAQALRAHAEWQLSTGATGLARASEELRAEREAAAPAAPAPAAAHQARAAEAAASRLPPAPAAERDPAPAPAQPPATQAAEPRPAPAVEDERARRPAPPAPRPVQPAARTSSGPARRPTPADAALAVADEERAQRLSVLATEVAACTRCPLHEGRTQTVFSRGSSSSGLCFIGEGPGADEDAQGYPFVGKAGQLLDRMIAAMGLSCDEVYVCNIVKCRPPKNRKPAPEEMAACMPYLEEQLALIEPTVIVAMGATAVQGLLGTTAGITRLRGKWKLYKGKTAVMPTFHPAYLLRTPRAKREVWEDLQAVLRQMGRPIPARK